MITEKSLSYYVSDDDYMASTRVSAAFCSGGERNSSTSCGQSCSLQLGSLLVNAKHYVWLEHSVMRASAIRLCRIRRCHISWWRGGSLRVAAAVHSLCLAAPWWRGESRRGPHRTTRRASRESCSPGVRRCGTLQHTRTSPKQTRTQTLLVFSLVLSACSLPFTSLRLPSQHPPPPLPSWPERS